MVYPKILALIILRTKQNEGMPYLRLLRLMRLHECGREAALAAIGDLGAEGCLEVHSVEKAGSHTTKHHFITEKGITMLRRYMHNNPQKSSRS